MNTPTIESYLALPYRIEVIPEADGSGYTVSIPDLPGCMTSSDSLQAALELLNDAKRQWLEVALGEGHDVPLPAPVELEEYAGKFLVRMSKTLHRVLARRALAEGVSINQLAVQLFTDGLARLEALSVRLPRHVYAAQLRTWLEEHATSIKGQVEHGYRWSFPVEEPIEDLEKALDA